jgi:hypothetical protein
MMPIIVASTVQPAPCEKTNITRRKVDSCGCTVEVDLMPGADGKDNVKVKVTRCPMHDAAREAVELADYIDGQFRFQISLTEIKHRARNVMERVKGVR